MDKVFADLEKAGEFLKDKQERKKFLEKQIKVYEDSLSVLTKKKATLDKAVMVAQVVAQDLQSSLEGYVSQMVSLALAAVFPDPYEFVLRFEKGRGKTGAEMLFKKGENEGPPMKVSGGGPKDIASLALRPVVWSLNPNEPFFYLDEPAKFVSRDLQQKVSFIIKDMSDKLGIQFLINSHIPEIIESADKVFEVEQVNRVSTIKEVDSGDI